MSSETPLKWIPAYEGCITIRRNADTDEIIVYRQDGLPMTWGEAHGLWWLIGQYTKLSPEGIQQLIENTEIPDHSCDNTKPQPGYVYLAECNDLYKIGISGDVEKRIQSMQSGSPNKITLICTIHSEDMRKLEKELHRRFASKRAVQEWFNLTRADIEYIRGLANE